MIEKCKLDRNEANFMANSMAIMGTRAMSNYTYESLYVGRKMSESRAKERAEKRL
jgi:hypothetical protein